MTTIRDIRDHLPRSKQTDPNNFPPYVYQPYPRMLKGEDGKPLRDKYKNYVIVNSEAEERAFWGQQEQSTAKAVGVEVDAPISETVNVEAPVLEEAAKRRGRPTLPKNLK